MLAPNFDSLISDFKKATENPSEFLSNDENLSSNLKRKLKCIYDFSKTEQIKKKKSNALPELIVANFDFEQIWQQLELQNEDILTEHIPNVSKFVVRKDKLLFSDIQQSQLEKTDEDNTETNTNGDEKEEDINNEENQSDKTEDSDLESDNDFNVNESNDSDESENENIDGNSEGPSTKKKKKSVVDDDFFKLDEMEQFLNQEEKKMDDPDSGKESESDSNEESIDLFEEQDSDDEDEEGNKDKTAKFKDFFRKSDEAPSKKNKRNKFLEELSDNEQENGDETHFKSSLEERQERLQKRIENLENKAVSEKPWQLKGEITASTRPQNSLLEEVLDFDLTTRPAPVITEKTTFQLEDIIRQRIKDKVFDSVERKIKPIDTPLEYKKKLVLDQEKSKLSLAQIYEKEFQEQQAAIDPSNEDKPEEPESHKEVKKMMRELFSKLDALSNFHFTPKPAMPELKVVTNLPAISMEEVAPIAMSEAGLLAPEEIKNRPKGDIIGKGERTATDKRRERRKKKQKQRAHLKAKEAKEKKKPRIEIGVPKKYGKGNATKGKSKKKI